MTQMQGIVSILGSDNHEKTTTAASLRRTLSADMSSKRWLAENGPVMKKVASSEQIAAAVDSSEDEEECEVNGKGAENPRRIDIWTAIMSQKAQDGSVKLPPPYIHPLVKKSSSSLSEKSLKVCTESLGSETGSDVFSLSGDENKIHEIQEDDETKEADREEQNKVVRLAGLATKKAQQARSFPPPLPSLAAARTDGPSLHMHSHRIDGRLVLEAVSIPQQKYFEAQRHDGHFRLTLINNPNEHTLEKNIESIYNHDYKKEDEEEVETDFDEREMGILSPRPPNTTSLVINIHKSTVSIKRITERDNENPSWAQKPNAKSTSVSKLEIVEEKEASKITQSLPTLPRRATGLPPLPRPPSAAASFNSYQYFWRAKPTVASVISQERPPAKTKDLVLLRGNKADCLIPSFKGCKEARRSILMWEPFCIATS